ncbi:hypothetical protein E2562_026782 [Oryza meyeriana var. granulata]|uniref:Uncharacterized protein n=1 Tax=Oryza meyeriana var. granulata TaxID=110450 RepID=A0A6G1C905_9ORYZ|nr:hypothetical protein E2562_026782 [Oryza meyeriana var. granulata]
MMPADISDVAVPRRSTSVRDGRACALPRPCNTGPRRPGHVKPGRAGATRSGSQAARAPSSCRGQCRGCAVSHRACAELGPGYALHAARTRAATRSHCAALRLRHAMATHAYHGIGMKGKRRRRRKRGRRAMTTTSMGWTHSAGAAPVSGPRPATPGLHWGRHARPSHHRVGAPLRRARAWALLLLR